MQPEQLGRMMRTHTSTEAKRGVAKALEQEIFGNLSRVVPDFGNRNRSAATNQETRDRRILAAGTIRETRRRGLLKELVAGGGFEPPTFGL
jgi:hypothetical protein